MSYRAICLTGDPILRRTLRRTFQATGSTVEFAENLADLERVAGPPDLVVMDKAARLQVDNERLASLLGAQTKVVVLGESLAEDQIIEVLRKPAIDHVITQLNEADEDELVVSATKLLRGDIFGLEKYLAWGVLVHEREVADYDEKRESILEVAEFAKEAGARRQVVARIESVTDELLMNALYDAPAVRYGVRPRIGERSRAGLGPLGGERALLRYACDGRYFAVSVKDSYGELRKDAILDHLARARAQRGTPKLTDKEGGGAGLGLYFVISSVTRFIANIHPGQMTEVICLFDLRATGREQEMCARSLHIFTAGGAPGNGTN